jgi:hypothetical protein
MLHLQPEGKTIYPESPTVTARSYPHITPPYIQSIAATVCLNCLA